MLRLKLYLVGRQELVDKLFKEVLQTSVGIEPTTSGLDLPLLLDLPLHRGHKNFFFTSRGSLIPFTRANAQWVFMGLHSTLTYTSELILCFTICVHSATRHNIYINQCLVRLRRRFKE